jgi:hypothetical protein
MCKHRRVFPYTLSHRDFILWRSGISNSKRMIEGVARKRARAGNRNVALILDPNGSVLSEIAI